MKESHCNAPNIAGNVNVVRGVLAEPWAQAPPVALAAMMRSQIPPPHQPLCSKVDIQQ